MFMRRRDFLVRGAMASSSLLTACQIGSAWASLAPPRFRISLAEWSFHRSLFAGDMSNLDFPARARQLGLDTVEYVNTFFREEARNERYLRELERRCADAGVHSRLIMCDGEGVLGDLDPAARIQAVENHHRWIEAAARLGCDLIRVNIAAPGPREEVAAAAIEGLRALADYGDAYGIDIVVENHGGWSSHGAWLADVIQRAGHPRIGTLPDFGNFRIGPGQEYDRYRGVAELMPYAKAVSAKSYAFDPATGAETTLDYPRLLDIVAAAGYHGYLGIEYEGTSLPEPDGILATIALIS